MSGYKSPIMREVCIFGWAEVAGERVGVQANFGKFKPGFERTYDELTKNLTQADLNTLMSGMLPPGAVPGGSPVFHLMTPEAYHAEFDSKDADEDDTRNDETIDEEGDE